MDATIASTSQPNACLRGVNCLAVSQATHVPGRICLANYAGQFITLHPGLFCILHTGPLLVQCREQEMSHSSSDDSAGHVLYHGPQGEVMGFFQSLGFDIPKRKGIPDFLQEVSGRKDQQVHRFSLLLHVADMMKSLTAQ